MSPTTLNWWGPVAVMMLMVSPTLMCSLSAVALSITVSVAPFGAWPSRITIGLSDVSPSHEMPNVGAPPLSTALPSGLMMTAWRWMPGVTRPTPGTASIVGTMSAGSGSRLLPSLVLPNASLLRTSRSVCELMSVNSELKPARIESASTNEPTTNETPMMMATAMAMSRPMRARMLRRARSKVALPDTISPRCA